jgi:hypothetical protein
LSVSLRVFSAAQLSISIGTTLKEGNVITKRIYVLAQSILNNIIVNSI